MTSYEILDLIMKASGVWALWALGVQVRIWRKTDPNP